MKSREEIDAQLETLAEGGSNDDEIGALRVFVNELLGDRTEAERRGRTDAVDELYSAANDAQADTLDELRKAAGQVWICRFDRWRTPADKDACAGCGKPRPSADTDNDTCRCGSPLGDEDGCCTDETCPHSDRLQHETYTEE
jgi:hypothetical protein